MVISTDPDAFETAPKTVLETYIRQVDKLVHLTINGEKIITTDNHPFYVQGRGFIEAGNLLVGDKLISVNGEDLIIENGDTGCKESHNGNNTLDYINYYRLFKYVDRTNELGDNYSSSKAQ